MFAPGWGCLSVLVGYHVVRVVATGSAGRNEFCRIYEFLQLCDKIFAVKCNGLMKGIYRWTKHKGCTTKWPTFSR